VKAFGLIARIVPSHLQDATPLALGQEFSGYATQLAYGTAGIAVILPLAQGGSAVGTGSNINVGLDVAVVKEVAMLTSIAFIGAPNKLGSGCT
jgi:fumarate hydratase class II